MGPVGARLELVPDGARPALPGRLPIFLGRERAFGSGGHETTRSCLEMLEAFPPPPRSAVLDWGSGTGVLAIAALRLGAGRAVALDVDAEATAAARRNARRNGLEGSLAAVRGSLDCLRPGSTFGAVLANLYGDLLAAAAQDLASLVAPGGVLVLSGMGVGEESAVRRRLAAGPLSLERRAFLEEFVTQVWRRPR